MHPLADDAAASADLNAHLPNCRPHVLTLLEGEGLETRARFEVGLTYVTSLLCTSKQPL